MEHFHGPLINGSAGENDVRLVRGKSRDCFAFDEGLAPESFPQRVKPFTAENDGLNALPVEHIQSFTNGGQQAAGASCANQNGLAG
jgi:hypothetical protein